MLDFVNVGQGMEAVNRLNGFTSWSILDYDFTIERATAATSYYWI